MGAAVTDNPLLFQISFCTFSSTLGNCRFEVENLDILLFQFETLPALKVIFFFPDYEQNVPEYEQRAEYISLQHGGYSRCSCGRNTTVSVVRTSLCTVGVPSIGSGVGMKHADNHHWRFCSLHSSTSQKSSAGFMIYCLCLLLQHSSSRGVHALVEYTLSRDDRFSWSVYSVY